MGADPTNPLANLEAPITGVLTDDQALRALLTDLGYLMAREAYKAILTGTPAVKQGYIRQFLPLFTKTLADDTVDTKLEELRRNQERMWAEFRATVGAGKVAEIEPGRVADIPTDNPA